MKFATKLLATMGAVMTLAAPMAHAADEIKIEYNKKVANAITRIEKAFADYETLVSGDEDKRLLEVEK